MRFRVILLTGWILGMLLPMYWFSRFSPAYGAVFDGVFGTENAHVLMHTFLYAVLAYLIASILFPSGRSVKRVFLFTFTLVVVVAVFQEGIQMIFARAPFAADDIFDLFVDLSGGLVGTILGVKFRSKHRA